LSAGSANLEMSRAALPEFTEVDASEREAYLDQVLVGGREQREIVIVDYDPAWPARFALERDRIRRALDTSALRIERVGSTAVPGLARNLGWRRPARVTSRLTSHTAAQRLNRSAHRRHRAAQLRPRSHEPSGPLLHENGR
jgi:GrpB protein